MAPAMTDSNAAKPRFRVDYLAAEVIDEGGQRFVDVIDPDSGDGYRFYEVEYALACGMDGERDLAGVAAWAERELGVRPTSDELASVATTLEQLGFLDGASGAVAAPAVTPAPAVTTAPAPAVTPAPAPMGMAAPLGRGSSPAIDSTDSELSAGIVVGKPVAAPVEDFELGRPGASAPAVAATKAAPVEDFELGRPGASAAAPAKAAASEPIDLELGRPGASTVAATPAASARPVSTDLAVDFGIADVKEAVRASQMMKAVDLPTDLPPDVAAAMGVPTTAKAEPAAEIPAEVAAAKPAVEIPAEVATAKPALEIPAEVPAKPAAAVKAPIQLPAKSAAETASIKSHDLPAAKAGTSKLLITLLVLAILGAAAYFAYPYFKARFLDKPVPAPVPVAVVPPPAPLPAPTGELKSVIPADIELKASVAGTLAIVADSGDVAGDVATGAVLFELDGAAALRKKLEPLKTVVETRIPGEIAAHEQNRDTAIGKGQQSLADGFEAKAAESRKELEQKQSELDALNSELAQYVVLSPAAGNFKTTAIKGSKVAAADVLGTITPATEQVVSFALEGTSLAKGRYAVGDAVTVSLPSNARTFVCAVASAEAGSVVAKCPTDIGPAGTVLELK